MSQQLGTNIFRRHKNIGVRSLDRPDFFTEISALTSVEAHPWIIWHHIMQRDNGICNRLEMIGISEMNDVILGRLLSIDAPINAIEDWTSNRTERK